MVLLVLALPLLNPRAEGLESGYPAIVLPYEKSKSPLLEDIFPYNVTDEPKVESTPDNFIAIIPGDREVVRFYDRPATFATRYCVLIQSSRARYMRSKEVSIKFRCGFSDYKVSAEGCDSSGCLAVVLEAELPSNPYLAGGHRGRVGVSLA
jgi:hypothetical protein